MNNEIANNELIEQISELFKTLHDDVEKSLSELNVAIKNQEEYDYRVRNYLRAYGSWLEGTVYILKELIRKIEYKWHSDLPTASQLYLFEYDLKISGSGKPEMKPKKIGIKENLNGLFFICSEIFTDFSVDKSTGEWEKLGSFFKVRNDLMHPKTIDGIKQSKQQIFQIDEARIWVKRIFADILNKIIEKSKSNA